MRLHRYLGHTLIGSNLTLAAKDMGLWACRLQLMFGFGYTGILWAVKFELVCICMILLPLEMGGPKKTRTRRFLTFHDGF